MIVIDIGNTNIVIGYYYKKQLQKTFRFVTSDTNIFKKVYSQFNNFSFLNKKIDYNLCIISSVSKLYEKKIIYLFKSLNFKIINININNIPKEIKFNYVLNQLGADRIANTFAATAKYGKNSLVIDFGTATTFDAVINSIYMGGVIAPGINISHDALVDNASKLNKISIKKTKKIIGNDTVTSMQSGFYWGYVCLINGIINKIIIEKKYKPKIILTGGLANVFISNIRYKNYYEPDLTLMGLYLIGQRIYDKHN